VASVNELLIEALEAFGAPGSPTPATDTELALRIRRQLIRTYRLRIPQFVSGMTRDGIVTKAIVPSAAPAEDVTGIYAWPENLASATRPLILTDSATSPTEPRWYTNPQTFWNDFDLADISQGTPAGVLVRGKTFRFRPIPETALGPWLITTHGTLYPDEPADDDDTDAFALELEDSLVSGAVLFLALREGHDEIVERFRPQWEASLKQLVGIDLVTQRAVYTAPDF